MSCDDQTMQDHSQLLGEHDARITSNTKDIERHEKLYDMMIPMITTMTETLGEIKTQGKTLLKVVEDVEYLKDNAETKHTVERIHERVDVLEHKDEKEALLMIQQVKKDIWKGFIGLAFTIIGAVVFAFFKLN